MESLQEMKVSHSSHMGMNEDFAVYKCIKTACCCHELAGYYMLIISQQRGGIFITKPPNIKKEKIPEAL